MASHRHDRLTEDIRRELTDIFRMLKDPRITGMISIVKVDLSGDQSYCKVYISAMEGLARAKEEARGIDCYDCLIINDDLETCVDELHAVIQNEKKKVMRNAEFIAKIREELEEL